MGNIVDRKTLQLAVEQAQQLRDVVSSMEMKTHVEALDTLLSAVENERFAVGVVGMAKRGKSTLINALLGRSDDTVAPVGKFPATSVVTMFGYAAKEKAQVVFNDGHTQDIVYQEIRQFACEENNKGNWRGVKSIEVFGPFPGLHPNVFIVDTPGAGNSSCNLHEEILLNILPRIDALLFLVTADDPIKQDELALLHRIRGNDVRKLFFVVNKCDLCDRQELDEASEHNREILQSVGYADVPLYEISAEKHWKTRDDNGTQSLLEAVGALISEERVKIIQQRAADRLVTIRKQVEDDLAGRIEESEMSETELDAEKRAVLAAKRRLSSGKFQIESGFRAEWQDAIDKYDHALPQLEQNLKNLYADLIAKTSASKLAEMTRMIHTDVVLKIQETVQPHAAELSKSLNHAVETLQQSTQRVFVRVDSIDGKPFQPKDGRLKDTVTITGAAIPGLVVTAFGTALPNILLSLLPSGGGFIATLYSGVLAGDIAAVTAPIAARGVFNSLR